MMTPTTMAGPRGLVGWSAVIGHGSWAGLVRRPMQPAGRESRMRAATAATADAPGGPFRPTWVMAGRRPNDMLDTDDDVQRGVWG